MKCQKIGGRRYLCLAKFTLSSEYKWGKVRLYVVRVRLGRFKNNVGTFIFNKYKARKKTEELCNLTLDFFSDLNEVQFGAKRSLDF